MIDKNLIKKNYRLVLLGVFISAFILCEWIASGTFHFGDSETIIAQYKDGNSVYAYGYEVTGQEYYRKDSFAYIVLPSIENVDRITVTVDNLGNNNLAIKLFYSDGADYEYEYLRNIDGKISINLPTETTRVKIRFEGNLNKSIIIEDITLFRQTTSFNCKFVLTLGVIFTIIFILIVLFLRLLEVHMCDTTVEMFLKFLIVGEVIFWLLMFLSNGYYWGTYFFPNRTDCFMDHFNMLALLNNKDPYYLKASYPAICFLLLKILHLFMPLDIQQIEPGLELRNNSIAMFLFVLTALIVLYILATLFEKILCNYGEKKYILAILLSGPIMFAFQRGNIILLTLVFLLVYYLYFDSEEKKKRYIAYIALAFAASIKVYPALFGIMTLKKKRYKETIHLAIIGFLLFIIPFFAFDGIETFKEFLNGLSAAGTVMTSQGVGQNLSLENLRLLLNLLMGTNISSSNLFLVCITVVLLLTAYFCEKKWEALFLIATACVWYPAFSFTYVLVLYYPAIFAALKNTDEIRKNELIMLGTMMLPLGLPYMSWVDSRVITDNLQMPMAASTVLLYFIIISIVFRITLRLLLNRVIRINLEKLYFKIDVCVLALIFCAIVCISSFNLNRTYSNEYKFSGNGTEHKPYEIGSIEDFLYLVDATNSGETFSNAYFVQTANIVFDGVTSINPIGWTQRRAKFSGYYDGQGYSLINYYSMSDDDENMGVFGELDGVVCNLNVLNCSISGESVGSFAYKVSENGTILNCYVNGVLSGYRTGSFAAYNFGRIENSVAFVNLDSKKKHDIAAMEAKSIVINSYDSNNHTLNKLDASSLSKLNLHVDNNNKTLGVKNDLCYWVGDEKYFVKVSANK
ncbi:glycosyltransferase family 87 protein [Pseudobutyrivibrio xylanivorans]|uniref:glycosyltransferase family 87 protein n=1 Tax=Pseudobutyrivibrio xylanivorans TaxID=185007 RepID=UPI00142EF133|nr:glycosyltransferase family 87 protein [Pseudobutyrivibrio xylanivorans]